MPAIRRRMYSIHPVSGREVWDDRTPDAIFKEMAFHSKRVGLVTHYPEAYKRFRETVGQTLQEISKTPEGSRRVESNPGRVIHTPSRIAVTNTARLRYREKVIFTVDWQTEKDGVKTIDWSILTR